MDQAARDEKAAEVVITLMQERLGDPLLMDDFARATCYSKFHFCRLFRKATGVTPRRFLSALRLKESRNLLLDTGFTVSDISCSVGYNSVGTFSSRFTKSIGLSPSVFRRNGGFSIEPAALRVPGPSDRSPPVPQSGGSTLEGILLGPTGRRPQRIVIATFPTSIPEGRPLHMTTLTRPGAWQLPVDGDRVVYVAAAAIAGDEADDLESPLLEEQAHFVGRTGPIVVRRSQPTGTIVVRLHPAGLTDLPILFALPRAVLPMAAPAGRPFAAPPIRAFQGSTPSRAAR
jgi:AraC family transcriptional regulator